MLIECPGCSTKVRIVTSRAVTSKTRELYCQCTNLNCGKIFVAHVSYSHDVKPTGKKPDPELQPELCGHSEQMDIFEE